MRHLKLIALLLCSLPLLQLHAQNGSVSYSAGLLKAKAESRVLIVLAHGSDWSVYGERIRTTIWSEAEFQKGLYARGMIVADVDVLQESSPVQKKLHDVRNKGWKAGWVRSYPAVLAFTSGGALIGKIEGQRMPRLLEEVRSAIRAFALNCEMFTKFEAQFLVAEQAKNIGLQIEILLSIDRLPISRPATLIDRLSKLDPKDSLGHLARLTFPSWHSVVNRATLEAKKQKGQLARERLNGLLARNVLTTDQQAIVYLALGNMCRFWKGHELEAADPLRKSVALSPQSTAGIAAKYLLDHVVKKSEAK